MEFIIEYIGEKIINKLNNASEVKISVAYFVPNEETLNILNKVPELKLIISEEFIINNPYKLEKLITNNAKVKVISPDNERGKLHAKVFFVRNSDEDSWAMLGSANLTHSGLFINQEACIELDSTNKYENDKLINIENWFDELWNNSSELNLNQAKKIYDNKSKYKLVEKNNDNKFCNYWALKTTAGSYGTSYWNNFVEEGVIAMGWQDIEVNPVNATKEEIAKAVENVEHYNNNGSRTADKIKKFTDQISKEDKVLICRGYPSNSNVDVHIYGIARVIGDFEDDRDTSWWRFKRKAVIQVIDKYIPKELVSKSLKMGSMMEVIHNIDSKSFNKFSDMLHNEFGITIQV